MIPGTIILATRNAGKLREIRAILSDLPFRIIGLDDAARTPAAGGVPPVHPVPAIAEIPEIEETGETLEENALIKARTVHRLTGFPALSDDSGLEVDLLDGAPGVRSARFAGENATYADNNRKLLAMLAALGGGDRRARFRCVAAYAGPGVEHLAEGVCDGRIAAEPRGENGFGYDPIFIPAGFALTFAELPLATKNSLSHRSLAFRRMGSFLRTLSA